MLKISGEGTTWLCSPVWGLSLFPYPPLPPAQPPCAWNCQVFPPFRTVTIIPFIPVSVRISSLQIQWKILCDSSYATQYWRSALLWKWKISCFLALTWFSILCSLFQGLVSDTCLYIRSILKSLEARCKVWVKCSYVLLRIYSASYWCKSLLCKQSHVVWFCVCMCVKWSYFALGPGIRGQGECLSWFPRSSGNCRISVVNSVEGPGIKFYVNLEHTWSEKKNLKI